jgi:hypothetical protein
VLNERLMLSVPADLVRYKNLDPVAKYLYLMICLYKPKSVKELAQISGIYRSGVRRHLRDLEATGWIVMPKKPGMTPIIASAPKTTQDALVSRLKDARWETQHAGEFLMKAWLNLLVDSDNFTDSCRPSFLVNPETQKAMEYDRYYKEGVAFEFNGSQHYTPTERFSDIDKIRKTQLRDHLKAGLSQKHGIIYVEIIETDLNLDRMLDNIPSVLPLRPIDRNSIYVRGLTRLSEEYITNCIRMRSKEQK